MAEYLSAFRSGRSVVNQILTLWEIQLESQECKLEIFVAFIHFQQAYDRIKSEVLYKAFETFGNKGKIAETNKNDPRRNNR